MKNVTRTITVRWTYEGWHRWPEAERRRVYLSDLHRHLFYAELTVEVKHNDREIEFHDLLEHAREALPTGTNFNRLSCEDMATLILEHVDKRWEGRNMSCSVFEDNEVGATISWEQY